MLLLVAHAYDAQGKTVRRIVCEAVGVAVAREETFLDLQVRVPLSPAARVRQDRARGAGYDDKVLMFCYARQVDVADVPSLLDGLRRMTASEKFVGENKCALALERRELSSHVM